METLKTLYIFGKMIGVCPFSIGKDRCVRLSYCGVIYSTILAVCYSIFYIRSVIVSIQFFLPRQTPITQISNFAGLTIESGALIIAWMHFGFRPQRLQKILMKFKNINDSFKASGISIDDERFIGDLKIHIAAINVFWHLLCAYCILVIHYYALVNMFTWLPLMIPRIVNHNIAFIFVFIIKSIGQRFCLLNDKILGLRNDASTRMKVRQRFRTSISENDGIEMSVTLDPLEACGQMYSDLIDLTNIVVQFFSLTILLIIVFQCIQMASSLYTMCIIITDTSLIGWAFVWILWFAIHFGEMVIIVYVCDSTVSKANKTGSVLHMMILTGQMNKYIDSAKLLSFRLLQERLTVEVFGLFPLKLAIIYRIGSLIAAYVTVMIQLDSQNY